MTNTRKLTTMAMLIAVAVVLVMTVHIMIINPLEYDPGDIPILISGFLFGPVAGLAVTAITCVIQGLTVSAASGPWGILMHFAATGSFVLVSSLIYHRNKTLKNAVIGLACGGIISTALMIPLNIVVQPLWNGVPVEAVKQMIIPVLLPFNVIKVAINGSLTFLLYKPISKLVKGEFTKKSKKEANSEE